LKVYSIRRAIFWLVMALIVLLPVSRHWRVIIFGEHTTGIVQPNVLHQKLNLAGEYTLYYVNDISFVAGDSIYTLSSPTEQEMDPGREVKVCYARRDPTRFCILNFASLYLTHYTALVVILAVMWYAFYLSFNIYRREYREHKAGKRAKARADSQAK